MVQSARMDITLSNSLTKQKEVFEPMHIGKVNMYSCGPTVYKSVTIGNLRSYLFADFLRRMFELNGYEVKHVMNITDVGHLTDDGSEGEDKMEKEAQELGKDAWEIARMYTEEFIGNMEDLNMRKHAFMPKATEHIDEQIKMIQDLEERGFAYQISDGIYFDTSHLADYGQIFGGQALDEKEEGARVAVNSEKRNSADFALWKFAEEGVKRQMEWDSPWGVGFPGWHIECSAMSEKYLDSPFDVHTGGIDLIPVHHTNEIAQTEGARGHGLANYWLHNEFIQIDGGKMSKSLGNTYTLEDLKDRGFDPMAFRLFVMGAHYKVPQNFTFEALEANQNALVKLRRTLREWELPSGSANAELVDEFRTTVSNDLDMPNALALMWKVIDTDLPEAEKGATLLEMDKVLGLGLVDVIGKKEEVPDAVKALLIDRQKARNERNFEESDRLRDEIAGMGWKVMDGAEGQTVVKL